MSHVVLYWRTWCAAFQHNRQALRAQERDFTADIGWTVHCTDEGEMKPTRLQISRRAPEARLILVIAVLTAWTALGLALYPYSHEASSAPAVDRPSPVLPHTIPSRPVRA
jgi:hypothetical protein